MIAADTHILEDVKDQQEKFTRVDEVYSVIRRELLAARYGPGEWIRPGWFQESLNVSLSVVREALSRLAAEGLLEAVALRGFRVVQLSLKDLQDLTAVRVAIEGLALRESLAHGDTRWEAELLAAHHVLENTQMRVPGTGEFNTEFTLVHAAFHNALLAGCQNKRLLDIATSMRASTEMYRMWAPAVDATGQDIKWEHRELTRLALARDADPCVQLLGRHIEHTRQSLEGAQQLNDASA